VAKARLVPLAKRNRSNKWQARCGNKYSPPQESRMNRKSHIVWIAGLALSTPCSAQSTVDESHAYRGEFAASALSSSSFLAQDASAVKVSGQIQFRWISNTRDDVPGGGEDNASGFQTRRTKLAFKGNVGDKWSYKVNGAFSKSSGSFKLEDAYADYKTENGWKVRSGQFKLPFMREELVSSSRQLAAERSITNEFFNLDRTQGVQLSGKSGKISWAVAISDGAGTANTDFTSSSEADFGFAARIEYMFVGEDWNRFKDFTSWKGSDDAVMAGAAVSYQSGGETFATVDMTATGLTADVSIESNGWNAYFAGNYQTIEPNVGSDLDNTGFVVQGGYMFNPTWEGFGRYDMLLSDQNDDFSTVTLGVNHYFLPESHAAKFTADVQFFLDTVSTSDAPTSTSTALLPSGSDSQAAFRAQLQLLF
jgi:phosphate-selective porin OprO and OprP